MGTLVNFHPSFHSKNQAHYSIQAVNKFFCPTLLEKAKLGGKLVTKKIKSLTNSLIAKFSDGIR